VVEHLADEQIGVLIASSLLASRLIHRSADLFNSGQELGSLQPP
jgi:hypothetical protein